MKETIIEYLQNTVQTKKNMKKRIYDLEKKIKEAKQNEEFAISEMSKYKNKYMRLKRELKKKEN